MPGNTGDLKMMILAIFLQFLSVVSGKYSRNLMRKYSDKVTIRADFRHHLE